VNEGDLVEISSPRGRIEAPARISGIREGTVFVPFHYGYWDRDGDRDPRDEKSHRRAANELTITDWDPASKQPLLKAGAVSVRKVADGSGPAPAPTTGASTPETGDLEPTRGDESATVAETIEAQR
jgi:predicted molibdopterin-dependent oxidoreductase YjgC